MPLDTLTANHIGAQAPGGYEIQRVNNALLYIVGLDGNQDNVITLSLASFPIPKVSSGIIEVPFQNEKRKFAGNPIYDDLSVIFKDFVDKETAAILLRWRRQVHDAQTGYTGRAADYKKMGRVELFGPDNQGFREIELIGVWPSAYDGGEQDNAGEDAMQLTVTLTIDKWIPLFI